MGFALGLSAGAFLTNESASDGPGPPGPLILWPLARYYGALRISAHLGSGMLKCRVSHRFHFPALWRRVGSICVRSSDWHFRRIVGYAMGQK